MTCLSTDIFELTKNYVSQTNSTARCREREASRRYDHFARETVKRMWCVAQPFVSLPLPFLAFSSLLVILVLHP